MTTGRSAGPNQAAELLRDSDYRRLAAFIHARSGIRMPPSKKIFLEGRLRKRLTRLGFPSFETYCRHLFEQGGLAAEETALLDAITTNKTDFFREPYHFNYLTKEALPRLIENGRGSQYPMKLWSSACSNGAEPYTIAMVCQAFAERQSFQFEILASDICTAMLEQAARAIYPHTTIEPVPMELRKRFLLRDNETGEVRIAPELRRLVRFLRLNLIDPEDRVRQTQDIIFCRNVLIYFDKPTQQAVLQQLCAGLRPGGYLFLGHSESITGLSLPLRPVGPTIFIRETAP